MVRRTRERNESDRQPQIRAAAASIGTIFERQRSAVRFRDLTAQHESYSRSARLRREERHEQISCIRQTGAFVVDPQLEGTAVSLPADRHASARLHCGIGAVAYEIDQQLLELIRVG